MNKGFTLLELMGVIALLGIIALIAIPAIDRTLNSSKDKLSKTQETQIVKGAKEFFSDTINGHNNIYCLPGNDNSKCYIDECQIEDIDAATRSISIECLKRKGYLPFDIKDPKTDNDYTGKVVVTKQGNKYTYNVVPINQE